MRAVLLSALLSIAPQLVAAEGLVPCGGEGEPACQFCHVAELTNNVFAWLVGVLGIILVLIIIYAGARLVLSIGDAAALTTARRLIWNGIVGYVIVLTVLFLFDFGFRVLFGSEEIPDFGPWNAIQCVAQPVVQTYSRPAADGSFREELSDSEISDRVDEILAEGEVNDKAEAAAIAAGLTTDEARNFRALIQQESSGCQNKTGPATAYGTAYGCGQMLVSTARTLDPDLSGLSDSEVAARLRDNDDYNLALSAEYYSQLKQQFGGDTELALAAYNGGPGANRDSADCPGLKAWQCPWDEPGCHNTGRTDCARNEGFSSYEQTRHYVENITRIADEL